MNNVIEFSAATRPVRPARDQQTAASVRVLQEPSLTPRQLRQARLRELPPATETAKNSRLRTVRRDAWWHAGRMTEYWRARLDWEHALGIAQQYGIADSTTFPPVENERIRLVAKWREAVVRQLLTPAPDVSAITWKRAKLAGRELRHLPIEVERLERVIADDVEFLAAHPTRRR